MNEDTVNNIMASFHEAFMENLTSVEMSGALSGDEPDGMVVKVVLYLTAENFRPLSEEGKELVQNLKHFV